VELANQEREEAVAMDISPRTVAGARDEGSTRWRLTDFAR
jgi:hypothetical protein